jgi:UDP-N-acetylglucosamine diphosphorylase / glucose-1-phosphate thymidylyltransferase / UDP-N-acetylgalactosamine diphosphorylase / glucosamine-1-phosphate N-acetyltransferase / galactosamine-1-phosphate N-acetyltransferase
MYKTEELLDLDHTMAKDYLSGFDYPWKALSGIGDLINELIKTLDKNEYVEIKENVWAHKSAKIYESAYIDGPCIIGENSEVRHCAFIRGKALIGKNCVVGNSCELKNVILFDHVQVPHFNYVGDSILGYYAHMGAGSITSNVRSDKTLVKVHAEEDLETGLKKFGAIVGDYVEVGCNAVLNPGTVVGRHSMIYPTSCVRGVIKENSIYKDTKEIIER